MIKVEKIESISRSIHKVHGASGSLDIVYTYYSCTRFDFGSIKGGRGWTVKGYDYSDPHNIYFYQDYILGHFTEHGEWVCFDKKNGDVFQLFPDDAPSTNMLYSDSKKVTFLDREDSIKNKFHSFDFENKKIKSFDATKHTYCLISGNGKWCFGIDSYRSNGKEQHTKVVAAPINQQTGLPDNDQIFLKTFNNDYENIGLLTEHNNGIIFQLEKESIDILLNIGGHGEILGEFQLPTLPNMKLMRATDFPIIETEDQPLLIIGYSNWKECKEILMGIDPHTGEEHWRIDLPDSVKLFIDHYMIAIAYEFDIHLSPEADHTVGGHSWKVDLRTGKMERFMEEPLAEWLSLAGDGFLFAVAGEKKNDLMYATIS